VLTAGVVSASASLTLGGGKEQRTAKGKPGFVSVAAQLAIAPDAALRSLAYGFQVDRAAPVNLGVVPQRWQVRRSPSLRGSRRTRAAGGETRPLRLRAQSNQGAGSRSARPQPQQPAGLVAAHAVRHEQAVASAARVGRTYSLSRRFERVLHIGRRLRLARGEAKTRIRLGRGTTSDCTGRRAAEIAQLISRRSRGAGESGRSAAAQP